MSKKQVRSFPVYLLLVASLLIIAGCSDTQNLKKKSDKVSDKSVNAISLKFTDQTTTENGVTINKIDKVTSTKYTKILSNIFAKGSRDPKLFSDTIFTNAKPVFTPSKDAKDEKVDVTLNILKSEIPVENIAVATISQSKVESGKTLVRTGTIYFNLDGLITGYKLSKFAEAGSTS